MFCSTNTTRQLLIKIGKDSSLKLSTCSCSSYSGTQKRKRKLIYSKGKTFVDWKRILVKAGNGGNGSVSFVHSRDHKGGPNGGDGGTGGDVVFVADENFSHFSHLNHLYRAQSGGNGSKKNRHGKNATNLLLQVPVGTEISNSDSNEVLTDLVHNGDKYIVAKGGEKGLGNVRFRSPTNVRPKEFTEGDEGDELFVELELKSIADIGLVGFPNAGKSSLLRSISRASPKIGDYPFTTLKPNIGVMYLQKDVCVTVADIPGIIKGAHENIGLGHEFLRHVERCHMLMYVLDCSSPDILQQFQILQQELDLYKPGLSTISSLFVANKCDLIKDHFEFRSYIQQHVKIPVVTVSAKYNQNISDLNEILLTKWKIR